MGTQHTARKIHLGLGYPDFVIQVHVWEEPDWFDEFAGSLGSVARCSKGKEIPASTEVLVKGSPSKEEIASLSNLTSVVVPFAGIPAGTRELLLDQPKISLYNLHHNSADTAEMAIALYMAAAKRIVPRDRDLREGKWSSDSFLRYGSSDSVRADGKQALVLGYGAIGQRIGRVCEAMGMTVTGVRRSGPFSDQVRSITELDQLLPKAEALFIALPLTPETKGLLNKERIGMLPANCIVSNIGRGAIIEEEPFFEALKSNRILAAGLDVWWKYPDGSDAPCYPSNFSFHELPNVVMTPHVGGSSDASEAHRWRALSELVMAIASGSARAASVQEGY